MRNPRTNSLGGLTMLIARWNSQANFGHKSEAIHLLKEWNEKVGSQTNIDVTKMRISTGSVGLSEALIESEFAIESLGELQDFFDKISTIQMHADWGKQMGEVIVSGSTRWDVLRLVD